MLRIGSQQHSSMALDPAGARLGACCFSLLTFWRRCCCCSLFGVIWVTESLNIRLERTLKDHLVQPWSKGLSKPLCSQL